MKYLVCLENLVLLWYVFLYTREVTRNKRLEQRIKGVNDNMERAKELLKEVINGKVRLAPLSFGQNIFNNNDKRFLQ